MPAAYSYNCSTTRHKRYYNKTRLGRVGTQRIYNDECRARLFCCAADRAKAKWNAHGNRAGWSEKINATVQVARLDGGRCSVYHQKRVFPITCGRQKHRQDFFVALKTECRLWMFHDMSNIFVNCCTNDSSSRLCALGHSVCTLFVWENTRASENKALLNSPRQRPDSRRCSERKEAKYI